MKHCDSCRVEKPLSDFSPNKTGVQGVRPRCRVCEAAVARARRAAASATTSATRSASTSATQTTQTQPDDFDVEVTWAEPAENAQEPAALAPGTTNAADPALRPNFVPRVEDGLKRHLFIPDVHRPFHDKAAWRLLLHVAQSLRFDSVTILGDFVDCYSVSFHDKDPRRRASLKAETDDANVGLDELDALGIPTKRFICGNHEQRLQRYIGAHAAALADYDATDLVSILRLRERGWAVTPYKAHTRIGQMAATHDVGTAGIYATRRAGEAFQGSVSIGHIHSMSVSHLGNSRGELQTYASFGWLGDREAVDYMHRIKAMRDWALGFGIGLEEPDGFVHVVPVPIRNYRCVVEGRLYAVR